MTTPAPPPDITLYLGHARRGDKDAVDRVFALVYEELRTIADRQIRRTGGSPTLSTTVVVHEAYLKLVRGAEMEWNDRGHFYAVAATAMRHILINYARQHLAQKRGAGAEVLSLDDADVPGEYDVRELVDLDGALTRLAQQDERLAKVVDLRFFAGLSVEETAAALGVGSATVKRDWRVARAFLFSDLQGDGAPV